jgi:hypothetical protein
LRLLRILDSQDDLAEVKNQVLEVHLKVHLVVVGVHLEVRLEVHRVLLVLLELMYSYLRILKHLQFLLRIIDY